MCFWGDLFWNTHLAPSPLTFLLGWKKKEEEEMLRPRGEVRLGEGCTVPSWSFRVLTSFFLFHPLAHLCYNLYPQFDGCEA